MIELIEILKLTIRVKLKKFECVIKQVIAKFSNNQFTDNFDSKESEGRKEGISLGFGNNLSRTSKK